MTKKKTPQTPQTPLAAALDKGLGKPKNPRIQAAAIKASKAKAAKAATKTKEVMTRMKRKLHFPDFAEPPSTTLVRFATDGKFIDTFDTDTTMRIELAARTMQTRLEEDNRLIADLRRQLSKVVEEEKQAVAACARGVLNAVEDGKRIKALEEELSSIKALRSSEAVAHHDDSQPDEPDEDFGKPARIGGGYAEVADEIVDGPDPDADVLEEKDHAALACSAPPDHLPDYSHDAAEFEALVADPAVP